MPLSHPIRARLTIPAAIYPSHSLEKQGCVPDANEDRNGEDQRMSAATNTDPIRLMLELEPDHEPIQGKLTEPDAQPTPFRGWLALTALIEAARTKTATSNAARPASRKQGVSAPPQARRCTWTRTPANLPPPDR
jgi:hypothetical protein